MAVRDEPRTLWTQPTWADGRLLCANCWRLSVPDLSHAFKRIFWPIIMFAMYPSFCLWLLKTTRIR